MLQPRQPRLEFLDASGLSGDLLGPSREKRDQLLTRHLLRRSHAKITTALRGSISRDTPKSQQTHQQQQPHRPVTVACVQRRDQTVRSGHRRGKSGLADPPALIPPLVVEEDLEQAGPFQTLARHLDRIPRQRGSRITPNGVTYGVDPVRSDALSPSIDVLAAITPNTYSVSGSASATSTARASSMATPITIAAYPDPPTGRTAAHPSSHPRNG